MTHGAACWLHPGLAACSVASAGLQGIRGRCLQAGSPSGGLPPALCLSMLVGIPLTLPWLRLGVWLATRLHLAAASLAAQQQLNDKCVLTRTSFLHRSLSGLSPCQYRAALTEISVDEHRGQNSVPHHLALMKELGVCPYAAVHPETCRLWWCACMALILKCCCAAHWLSPRPTVVFAQQPQGPALDVVAGSPRISASTRSSTRAFSRKTTAESTPSTWACARGLKLATAAPGRW